MFLFKKVFIKNFLSIGEAELGLDNQGVVLIEGINETNETFKANGAGKTSLMDAITYALYDTTSSGLKADAIVNRQVGKDTQVILEAEVDGIPYRIERYRKDKKNKNKVKLFREEEEITAKSAADTNKMIQGLFGIDYNTYANSIMYGQGEQVIFANASDKGKKEILENITSISIYKQAQEIAKSKVVDKKAETNTILTKVNQINQELEKIQALEAQDFENYSHTAALIEENKKEHERVTNEIADSKLEERLAAQTEAHEEVLRTPEEQMDYTEPAEVTEMKEQLESWKTDAQEIQSGIRQNRTRITQLKTEQRNLDTQTVCSYCGSPLDASHAEKEFTRLQGEIAALEDSTSNIETMLTKQFDPLLQAKRDEIDAALQSLVVANNKKQAANASRQNWLNQSQNEMYSLETKLQQLRSSLTFIENSLVKLENVPKPIKRDAERKIIQEQLDQLQLELLAASSSQEKYEEAVKMFSNTGIRSVVLDLVTPFLNEKANKYLATLSGSDIEINFTTQVTNKDGTIADKFDVEIVNSSGGDTYKSNSEGEKKRIDLAISFAIQDLVLSKAELKTNLALYDECFESLDEIGCENVVLLLKERVAQVGSIFVITHNSALKALFEKVITIKKENGMSFLIN